jgi:phage terminase large subunit GpA-like protein
VKKPGSRDEALDCTVLAIHAAKRLYLHLWSEAQWGYAEQSLLATQVAEPELLDSTYNLGGAR